MLVCLCKGVSDRTIRETIEDGADTIDAVAKACGAGSGCGACHDDIALLIAGGASTPLELVRHGARAGSCPQAGVCSVGARKRVDEAA